MNREIIAKNLKLLRDKLGLNQRQFAEPLGITGGYVSKVEKGQSVLSDSVICLIEINYRINRDWLLEDEGEPFIKEWIEDKNFLFSDKGGPIKEHSQNLGMHLEVITKEEAERRKIAESETINNKDKNISSEDRLSDHEARLVALEESLNKQSAYIIEIRNRELEAENKNLKAEINRLNEMAADANQEFKDLVIELKEILENESPPENITERRKSITEIKDILRKKDKKLHNGVELNSLNSSNG